jgi:single-strand DNA-binding protein
MLVKVCESYLHKGDLIHLEGQIETRKYEKDGREVYTTEIVLRPFKGELTILASKKKDDAEPAQAATHKGFDAQGNGPAKSDMDDEIPF